MLICLFDIDGTLLSSGGAGKTAMETALVREFGLTRIESSIPYAGRTDRVIGRDLFALHGVENSPENWQRFIEHYLQLLPGCLRSHQGKVLPGIATLLNQLREREDVVLGLLTGNLHAGARVKLGHYGLFDHFQFGGFGDHHFDRDDEAREALAEIHKRYNGSVDHDRVWVIGDTPLDVRCARCINAKVVAVATGQHSVEELRAVGPDLVLADLADPSPLLAAWN